MNPTPTTTTTKNSDNTPLQTDVNITGRARDVSLLGGLFLLGFALIKRGRLGAASAVFGSTLVYQAVTGVSQIYRLLKVNRAVHNPTAAINVPHEQGHNVRTSITINRPAHEIYAFWRDFVNLPEFMPDLKSVVIQNDRHSRWSVVGPLGMDISWDAEIISDEPDYMISWRSLKNPYVDHAGSVYFKPAPSQQGTEVQVEMKYLLIGGTAGEAFAKILGHSPKNKVDESLKRLKQILETGSTATAHSEGS